MAKLLNLDELAGAKRTVTYKGINHEIIDLPLEDFIVFQQDFDALLKVQGEGNMVAMVDYADKIVKTCAPTFTDLRKLNIRQTMALVQLIADFYPQEAGSETPQGNAESPSQTT